MCWVVRDIHGVKNFEENKQVYSLVSLSSCPLLLVVGRKFSNIDRLQRRTFLSDDGQGQGRSQVSNFVYSNVGEILDAMRNEFLIGSQHRLDLPSGFSDNSPSYGSNLFVRGQILFILCGFLDDRQLVKASLHGNYPLHEL